MGSQYLKDRASPAKCGKHFWAFPLGHKRTSSSLSTRHPIPSNSSPFAFPFPPHHTVLRLLFLSFWPHSHDAALRRSPHRPRPRLFDDRIASRRRSRHHTKRKNCLLTPHHVTQPRNSLEGRLQTDRHMGYVQCPVGGRVK